MLPAGVDCHSHNCAVHPHAVNRCPVNSKSIVFQPVSGADGARSPVLRQLHSKRRRGVATFQDGRVLEGGERDGRKPACVPVRADRSPLTRELPVLLPPRELLARRKQPLIRFQRPQERCEICCGMSGARRRLASVGQFSEKLRQHVPCHRRSVDAIVSARSNVRHGHCQKPCLLSTCLWNVRRRWVRFETRRGRGLLR